VDLQVSRSVNTQAATGIYSVLGGGQDNTVVGSYAIVAGGSQNSAGTQYGVVGGGIGNSAAGDFSIVPGGETNLAAGSYSLAAGRHAHSDASGAFTWADSEGTIVNNAVADMVRFKARGGFMVSGSTNAAMSGTANRGFIVTGNGLVGISTSNPQAALDVVAAGDSASDMVTIWRSSGGVIVSSISAAGVMTASKFIGDGSGLSNLGNSAVITVSTINATATTPYGGINITTNTFVQGKVGIATTNPQGMFQVGGGTFTVLSGGNVGVGTAAPAAKLHVQAYEAGVYTMQVSTSSTPGVYSVAVSSQGMTNINNLVIENRTSDPVSPVTGQIWLIVN
jgi:hypothetical protein